MNRTLSWVFVAAGALACATPRRGDEAAATPKAVAPPETEAWRAKPPPPGPAPAVVLPVFQKVVLPNGLTVLVQERRDLPLVTLMVAFAAGSATDPSPKAGLADLTYRVMLEGAGKRNALELAEAFADLGTSASVMSQSDGAAMGVQVLSRNADPALALLADIAQRPKLLAEDFTRKQEERRADLLASEMEPRVAGQTLLGQQLFGATHPYAHPSAGTSATLPKVKHGDAKAFYRRWVGPRATALVVTGDVTLEQAVALAQKHFGGWRASVVRPPRAVAPPEARREKVFVVSRPGLEQTLIMFGSRAIRADDPDQAPLELAVAALGGNFGSRLNLNLREDKGYTYGIGAMLDARRSTGAWMAMAAVRRDATGAALQEIVKEIDGARTRPFSTAELEGARAALVFALPGSFETTDATALALTSLFFEERPLDAYSKEVAALEATTPAQIADVVKRYFAADTMRIVLVGDPEAVSNQIVPLGLGKLTTVEPISSAAPTPKP